LHPNAETYGIVSHRIESASHFAMQISLFSSLIDTYICTYLLTEQFILLLEGCQCWVI